MILPNHISGNHGFFLYSYDHRHEASVWCRNCSVSDDQTWRTRENGRLFNHTDYQIEPEVSAAAYFSTAEAVPPPAAMSLSDTFTLIPCREIGARLPHLREKWACRAEDTPERVSVLTGLLHNGRLHGIDNDMSSFSDQGFDQWLLLRHFADSPDFYPRHRPLSVFRGK